MHTRAAAVGTRWKGWKQTKKQRSSPFENCTNKEPHARQANNTAANFELATHGCRNTLGRMEVRETVYSSCPDRSAIMPAFRAPSLKPGQE